MNAAKYGMNSVIFIVLNLFKIDAKGQDGWNPQPDENGMVWIPGEKQCFRIDQR
jgi:hypothetical protein